MKRLDALYMSYKIAMLADPSDEALELLLEVSYERALEILLTMREYGRPIRTPANFIRRAIDEGWTPETTRRTANRRLENIEEVSYMRKGYTAEQAKMKVIADRRYSV